MKIVRPEILNADVGAVTSSVAEPEAAWSSGATYANEAVVYVNVDSIHRRYTSVQGSNFNHPPETDDGTWWLDGGATNRWAMFDGAVQTRTEDEDEIEVVLHPAGRVDTLALLNVDAAEVRVVIEDGLEGLIYDETLSLVSPSGITDLWAYLMEPIERLTDIVLEDLPAWAYGPTITVTTSALGQTVGVGALVCGHARELGGTQYGVTLGFMDYSVKQADEFGNMLVVERAYSKTASFDVIVAAGVVDQVQGYLAQYRATPILYLGDSDYAATAIYGFFKDAQTVIAYPTHSILSINVESVT